MINREDLSAVLAEQTRRHEEDCRENKDCNLRHGLVSFIPRPGRRTVRYFAVTAFVAAPHKLLRTVMVCGFTGHVNRPLYLFPS